MLLWLSESEVAYFGLEGPPHGRPMQLRSMGGGSRGVEEEQQLIGIGGIDSNNVLPAPAALQQSEFFAYQSVHVQVCFPGGLTW